MKACCVWLLGARFSQVRATKQRPVGVTNILKTRMKAFAPLILFAPTTDSAAVDAGFNWHVSPRLVAAR